MPSRTQGFRWAPFALALVLMGCGAAGFVRPPSPPTARTTAAGAFEITMLQSLSTARDVRVSEQRVYVATDRGVYSYPASGAPSPRRLTYGEALAFTRLSTGARYVLQPDGVHAVTDEGTSPLPAPPFELRDLHALSGDELFGCGDRGLVRYYADRREWVFFGEPGRCVRFADAVGDAFWVLLEDGLWRVDGDVITEYGGGDALPAGRPRAVVEAAGQTYALIDVGAGARLRGAVVARLHDDRFVTYTLPGLTEPLIGLGLRGDWVVLFTERGALRLVAGEGADGEALTPVHAYPRERGRLYRAEATASSPFAAPSSPEPRERVSAPGPLPPLVLGAAHRPVTDEDEVVPVHGTWLPDLGARANEVFAHGGRLYLAEPGRGVLEVGQGLRRLVPRDFVSLTDLQIADDAGGHTLVRAIDGSVARYEDGAARVLEGVPRTETLFSGPDGAYFARIDETGAVVVARITDAGPSTVATIPADAGVVSVPFGARASGVTWLGLVVDVEGEALPRGVAELHDDGTRRFHHANADRLLDGEGALLMPDAVTAADLNAPEMAWFATLSGAVRLGNSQAVVFGESRGVRGEVVTDVCVDGGDVWFAAAEGLGRWRRPDVRFDAPRAVHQSRPVALARDGRGRLFIAGARGLYVHRAGTFVALGQNDDSLLPADAWRDVEVDGQSRVWLLGQDGVRVLTPR